MKSLHLLEVSLILPLVFYFLSINVFLLAAAQLQKFEDSAPVSLEFERLKERFEPFLRASVSPSGLSGHSRGVHLHTTPVNPITAAAPSALACDTLGVGKYALAPHDRRDKGVQDEIHGYHSRVKVGGTKEGANVDFMQRLEEVLQVAALSQRWANSWTIDSALEVCFPFLMVWTHAFITVCSAIKL